MPPDELGRNNMKSADQSVRSDLVLIGGGHSHVAVIKSFAMRPVPGVRLTVIARDVHTPYSGMLPGLVAGHYTFDEAHVDLRPLCRLAGARLYHDKAVGLDTVAKQVLCEGRPPVPYDLLSVDIGSTPHLDVIQGAAEYAVPVKPIDGFVARWNDLTARAAAHQGTLRIAVVGAGAAGVEMTLAIQHRLKELTGTAPEMHLFGRGERILPAFPKSVARRFDRVLTERTVRVHLGAGVSEITKDGVRTSDGAFSEVDEILVVTGAVAQPWLTAAGLDVDKGGFLRVDDCLRSLSHPDIFAAGDVANVVNHPREKAGVFAVRQGPALADNLRRVLQGEAPKPFHPQRTFLTLISTGDQYAVAHKAGFSIEGAWVWRWKDRIDREWMNQYGSELPVMASGDDEEMRCGGCGAKVGQVTLKRALNGLDAGSGEGVLLGLDAPDDAAVIEVPTGKALVQSVDYFRSPIDDPYLFGRIAANHALGDLFAMGAAPHSALAVATLPYDRPAIVADTLRQLMEGATETLTAAGASLVGGHSGEGAELAVGFTVNGFIDPDKAIRKRGAQPGDVLILTKPLGTGTLLAADMRAKAKGKWIDEAISSMMMSNAEAATILMQNGATAMTDVTGFGLAGHLLEMLDGGVGAEIDLSAVPALEGALDCLRSGIASTLQPENMSAVSRMSVVDGADDAKLALLFDPQTAGGLLAAVPPQDAAAAVTSLRAGGYSKSVIVGRLVDDPFATVKVE